MSAPQSAPQEETPAPPSVTHFGACILVLVLVCAVLFAMHESSLPLDDKVLVMCAAVALPMILVEVVALKVHCRASTGLDWSRFSFSPGRTLTKLLGLALTLAPFAFAYWTFGYYLGAFFDPFYA